jgi:hypothetical protein
MRKTTLAVAVLVLLVGSSAIAQVTTGTILGTVKDPSGAVVPGVQIVVTEISKGISKTYITDDTGAYAAPLLIPGTYDVSAEITGFKKKIQTGVILQVDQKARVDFTLEIGATSETVSVEAAAPLVKTTSSELGDVIEERAVEELPLNGRNFATLVYLSPGVTPGQQGENLSGASTFNPRGASNFNALGSQANGNAWLIDGIDNNEHTFNTVIVMPTLESVREFKVLTGTYSAEFGRGFGVVSVSTKSGSNEFHGTFFEYLRNDVFDARPFFLLPSQKKTPLRRNQFGSAFSGPVKLPWVYNGHNRTWFFADYAGLREVRGNAFVNTVPTAKTRLGDFSDFTDASGNLIKIYDPLTTRPDPANPGKFLRDQFQGNVIPQNRLNPVGLNVAGIYPLPNTSGNFNNYVSSANREVTDDAFTARVDHKVTEKNSIFVRYAFSNYWLNAPQGQAQCCLPTPAEAAKKFDLGPWVAGIQNTHLVTQGLSISDSHIFRQNLINEFRTGFARTTPRTVQSDFGHNAATSLGIQGINISEFTTGIPNINVQDFTGLSGGPAFLPANPRETHYQVENNLYWNRGHHGLKFGYRYVRRLTSPFTNTDTRSTLNFNRNFTNDPKTNTQGTGLATLLIGYSTGGSRGFLITPYYMTNQDHAMFIQDDWKVSSRLTLNLGLRYDLFLPDVEVRDRLTNFDQVALKLIYAGENGVSRAVNKEYSKKDFAPRVGFAWDLLGKSSTIVRGGFGISYFPIQASGSNLLGQQVPWTISQNFAPETNPTDWTKVPLISNPFPAIAPIKPLTTADLNAANPRVIGHDLGKFPSYMETWNLDVQQQLTKSMVWEISYAGSRGIHLPIGYNTNEVQPGNGTQASRRLIQPLNNLSNFTMFQNRNMSTYHGMQTKMSKRFSRGMQFLSSYTWSESLDFGGTAASGGGSSGNPQTVTNIRAGRGPSGFDVKHRWVTNYLYELPLGTGHRWAAHGVPNVIVGGWQASGIVTLSTGRPYNVGLNTGVNNGAPSWPNRTGDGRLDNPTADKWFDYTAFVAPPANTYGNVARGVLYSPGVVQFDMSFTKNFKITEQARVEFRFDGFNIFNTPLLGFPNASIGSPTVGKITSTNGDNRDLQFALKVQF